MDACEEFKCEYNSTGKCSYERFMDSKRPCPPGKKCGFNPNRYPSEVVRAACEVGQKFSRLSDEENQQRQVLYDSGASDAEIASAVGVTHSAILYWRKTRRLPRKIRKEENS